MPREHSQRHFYQRFSPQMLIESCHGIRIDYWDVYQMFWVKILAIFKNGSILKNFKYVNMNFKERRQISFSNICDCITLFLTMDHLIVFCATYFGKHCSRTFYLSCFKFSLEFYILDILKLNLLTWDQTMPYNSWKEHKLIKRKNIA